MTPYTPPHYTVTPLGFEYIYGINNQGQIVGQRIIHSEDGGAQAVVWEAEKITVLPTPSLYSPAATQINDQGQIYGLSDLQRSSVTTRLINFYPAPLQWDGATHTLTQITADQLPKLSLPTGFTADKDTHPYRVNGAGSVIGSIYQGKPFWSLGRAFLWSQGKLIDLGALPGDRYSTAHALNSRGQIVGWSSNICLYQETRAVLWDRGKLCDLNALIPRNAGWTLEKANGINDQGWIVGEGEHNGKFEGYLLKPILQTDARRNR